MHSFSVILDKMEIVAGHNHTVQVQGCMKVFGVVTLLNIMAPCQMQSNIEKKNWTGAICGTQCDTTMPAEEDDTIKPSSVIC